MKDVIKKYKSILKITTDQELRKSLENKIKVLEGNKTVLK